MVADNTIFEVVRGRCCCLQGRLTRFNRALQAADWPTPEIWQPTGPAPGKKNARTLSPSPACLSQRSPIPPNSAQVPLQLRQKSVVIPFSFVPLARHLARGIVSHTRRRCPCCIGRLTTSRATTPVPVRPALADHPRKCAASNQVCSCTPYSRIKRTPSPAATKYNHLVD